VTELLRTRELSVHYGGNVALDAVSLRIDAGELVGLIGPNGAGKTTFIDALTGFTPSTGAVIMNGTDISRLKPHRRVIAGLGRTWQGAELYDELSVRENLEVGGHRPSIVESIRAMLTGRSPSMSVVDEAVDLLGLVDILDRSPDDLSQGQRKSVDVARALTAGSTVLCLDEPAAGLDTTESVELGRRLRRVVEAGTSLLLVDHDMGLVLGVCDRIYVLDLGKVIAVGTPDEIRRSPEVIDAYLGTEQSDGAEEIRA